MGHRTGPDDLEVHASWFHSVPGSNYDSSFIQPADYSLYSLLHPRFSRKEAMHLRFKLSKLCTVIYGLMQEEKPRIKFSHFRMLSSNWPISGDANMIKFSSVHVELVTLGSKPAFVLWPESWVEILNDKIKRTCCWSHLVNNPVGRPCYYAGIMECPSIRTDKRTSDSSGQRDTATQHVSSCHVVLQCLRRRDDGTQLSNPCSNLQTFNLMDGRECFLRRLRKIAKSDY